ncbi:type II toxin-antitoxin system VapC family toxin [Allomesorhizobium alhagi]|uniref:Ribonuclease VapC n=1 Tax=Mesorhizobium alhagi CCNWXJ12-2 TaxID=1107882 RepID=H0HV96_9HYPH|nr:PIN domain-containing protein [Mesorhizobium alhagi]EHK55353.1 PilT-like protein [Mesorhizobium alhagi CCNWXJ12-2]
MILVDSSIWIDHFRQRNIALQELLSRRLVLSHPFVIGELAMGSLRDRSLIIEDVSDLPMALVAEDHEVLALVDRLKLHGRGIGYLDVHLLASVRLTGNASLWTRDRRLHAAAEENGLAADLPATPLN